MPFYRKLNLPDFELRLQQKGEKSLIWDVARKKYVVLTPEEWVRQHFLHFLIDHNHYPVNLISMEKGLQYNRLQKRYDLLVYTPSLKPFLLVECKSYKVNLSENTLSQVSVYNKSLSAAYMIISNGLHHYCFDLTGAKPVPVQNIPAYPRD